MINGKFINTLVIIFLTGWIVSVTYLVFENHKSKIFYFNKVRLFNEFKYKKELVTQLDAIHFKNESQLDSIYAELNMMAKYKYTEERNNEINRRAELLESLRNKYADEESRLLADFDKRIYSQLNDRLKEYCNAHDIQNLFGFEPEKFDVISTNNEITDELIEFVNGK